MNHDLELQLQAYLDGELPPAEAVQMADCIRRDPEAAALFKALADTRTLLRECEPEYQVEATREFYWSQIERAIQREGTSRKGAASLLKYWQNWWVRIATAGVAAALVGGIFFSPSRPTWPADGVYGTREIEAPLEEVSAISFHSESANMTVVWVQTRLDTN